MRNIIQTALEKAAKELRHILAVNVHAAPEDRVMTLTTVVTEDDRFIAVNGSAHKMHRLFEEFFRERPEYRQVVQRVLADMYDTSSADKI